DEGAGRRAAVSHRLHHQRRFEPPEPDAAAFLRDVNRREAELGGGADSILGKDVLLVPPGGVRRYAVGGEAPRHVLDGELVVGEGELAGHSSGLHEKGMVAEGLPSRRRNSEIDKAVVLRLGNVVVEIVSHGGSRPDGKIEDVATEGKFLQDNSKVAVR